MGLEIVFLHTGHKTVGIAGLEQRRLDMRKNNELVIGNAFEDLEALMASAKEIVALAESFSSNGGGAETNAVANALGLVTTKEMLGGGSNSESLYISELSRNLAEFLTDDFWFIVVIIVTGIWQAAGYGAVIYLAALSGISPDLYEAAVVDGAGRWKHGPVFAGHPRPRRLHLGHRFHALLGQF